MVDRAIDRALAHYGDQRKMAQALGVSDQAISKWVKRGWVPILRAETISVETGVAAVELVSPKVRAVVCERGMP